MKHSFHFSTLAMLVWLFLIAQFAVAQRQPKKTDKPKIPPISSVVPKGDTILTMKLSRQDVLLVCYQNLNETLYIRTYVKRKYKLVNVIKKGSAQDTVFRDSIAIVGITQRGINIDPKSYKKGDVVSVTEEGNAIFDTTAQARENASKLRTTLKLVEIKKGSDTMNVTINFEYYQSYKDSNTKKRRIASPGLFWTGKVFYRQVVKRDLLGKCVTELNEDERIYTELFRDRGKLVLGHGYENDVQGDSELQIFTHQVYRENRRDTLRVDTVRVSSNKIQTMERSTISLKEKYVAIAEEHFVIRDSLYVIYTIDSTKIAPIKFHIKKTNGRIIPPKINKKTPRYVPPKGVKEVKDTTQTNIVPNETPFDIEYKGIDMEPEDVAMEIDEYTEGSSKSIYALTEELVEGKEGLWIEVAIMNADKKDYIQFPTGKYVMENEEHQTLIKNLNNILSGIYRFIKKKEKELQGGGNKGIRIPFELYICGVADIAGHSTFEGHKVTGFIFDEVTCHPCVVKQQRYSKGTKKAIIPDIFKNEHLPNLRACFVKYFIEKHYKNLTKVDGKPNEIKILEGFVDQNVKPEQRCVYLYLYIPKI